MMVLFPRIGQPPTRLALSLDRIGEPDTIAPMSNTLISAIFLSLVSLTTAQAQSPEADDIDPAHQRNPVYQAVLREGVKSGETVVALPSPTMRDDDDAAKQRAKMAELCGSDRAVDEFLRDSVTAPFILKTRDAKTPDAIIRSVDVWFVVRADLDKLDPVPLISSAEGQVVDVANMRFEQRLLTDDELKGRNLQAKLEGDDPHWFVLLKSRLLGRIGFEAVDEAAASRSASSMIVAARVSPTFDAPGKPRNHWRNLADDGPEQPLQGGVSYAKITKLHEPPGALFVELHAAFAEPEAWFRGAPILRSKFSLVAQDQIRRLRRELLKERAE